MLFVYINCHSDIPYDDTYISIFSIFEESYILKAVLTWLRSMTKM